ncbi:MAG: MFS transporter [Parasporobacterium sp.]|nr:MFS transporter [Parasporobacterium sp.]
MKNNKGILLKIAVLTMSMVQLGTNGISPILAKIGEAFPDVPGVAIQFLMTFPSIFCMIFVIISAFMAEKLPKKALALAGLLIVCAGGILATAFHGSITILYVWAGVIGIGLGMVAPIGPGLINETYTGSEQHTMLGWQSSASTIGGMLMTFIGGFLAVMGWNYGYLVYLLAVPGIIFTLIGVKGGRKTGDMTAEGKAEERPKFRLVIWKEMIITVLFLTVYSAIPVNMSELVREYALGDTAFAGTMSTVFMLAGMLMGLVFGMVSRIFRRMTNVAGLLLLAAGTYIMGLCPTVAGVTIGAFIAGTSMSTVMPVCMSAASRLRGYETINTALIMGSSYIGVFIAPLISTLTEKLKGIFAVSARFVTMGNIAVVIAILAILLKIGEGKRTGAEVH